MATSMIIFSIVTIALVFAILVLLADRSYMNKSLLQSRAEYVKLNESYRRLEYENRSLNQSAPKSEAEINRLRQQLIDAKLISYREGWADAISQFNLVVTPFYRERDLGNFWSSKIEIKAGVKIQLTFKGIPMLNEFEKVFYEEKKRDPQIKQKVLDIADTLVKQLSSSGIVAAKMALLN